MKQSVWDDYKRKTTKWRIQIDFSLLHSEAFRKIKYCPTLKALLWSYEKRGIRKTNKRKQRYEIIHEPFSFTYNEAKLRGLTQKQFARSVRELVLYGFWDLKKQGTGLEKDFSVYEFSRRWEKYGKPDFEAKQIPKPSAYGYRDKHKKEKTGLPDNQDSLPEGKEVFNKMP